MRMKSYYCVALLVLSLVSIVHSGVVQQQCMLPKLYDFEGAMRRNQAAAARKAQRQALLNASLHSQQQAEEEVNEQMVQKQQQEEEKRRQEQARKQQEEAAEKVRKQQQQEEEKRRQEQVKKQQEEQAQKQKQEEQAREKAKRKQQQEEATKRKQQEQQQRKKQQQNKPDNGKPPCPYTVLGVGRDATQAQIKAAYRKLAIQHHPDKNPAAEREKSKEHFTRLVDAYEILGDEDRRVMHDEESFGQYQSRPHNYNSKAGFYTGNSFVSPLNQTEFNRLVMCQGPFSEEEECEPYMIHFYTPWCVHCKNMIQEWKRAASTMDGTETPLGYVRFAGVNCETNKQLCRTLGINSYPEIHLYAQDAKGQEHMERFPSRRPRNVENFIEFAEKGIRLAHESTLQTIDAFIMDKNVTNAESTGLWIVMFEGRNCATCGALKASLRRMSANIRGLANFGVFDCAANPKICQYQYVGNKFPVLKLYPYKGAKGTGETLVEPGGDPLVLLPVVEKVIRMCLANIEVENGLMNPLHEEYEEEPEPPKPQYQYPEPERQQQHVLPAGVRANSRKQYIGG